jgi:hypothetical protein
LLDHLPPEKVPGLQLNRPACRQQAQSIGPATTQLVDLYLADPVLERLPTVGRLLRLSQRYGEQRLEAACARALAFADPTYRTVKCILKKGLEQEPLPASFVSPPATTFVRSAQELFGPDLGETRWN